MSLRVPTHQSDSRSVVPRQTLAARARALRERVEAMLGSACQAQQEHDAACGRLLLLRKKHMPPAAAAGSSKREHQRQSAESLVMIFMKVCTRAGYRAALAWMDPGARYVVLLTRERGAADEGAGYKYR